MAGKPETKIVFLGGCRAGVSTIVRRIIDKPFIESLKTNTLPLGVELHTKKHWKEKGGRDIIIWDVSSAMLDAPNEHLSTIMHNVEGLVFVLDASKLLKSSREIDMWLSKLSPFLPNHIHVPKLLMINKVDRYLENRNSFLIHSGSNHGKKLRSEEWLDKVTSTISQWVAQPGDVSDVLNSTTSTATLCPVTRSYSPLAFRYFVDYCWSVGDARFVDYDPSRGDDISLKQWTPQQAMEVLLNHIAANRVETFSGVELKNKESAFLRKATSNATTEPAVSHQSKDVDNSDSLGSNKTFPNKGKMNVNLSIRPLKGPSKPMRRSTLKTYDNSTDIANENYKLAASTTSSLLDDTRQTLLSDVSSAVSKEENGDQTGVHGFTKAKHLWDTLFSAIGTTEELGQGGGPVGADGLMASSNEKEGVSSSFNRQGDRTIISAQSISSRSKSPALFEAVAPDTTPIAVTMADPSSESLRSSSGKPAALLTMTQIDMNMRQCESLFLICCKVNEKMNGRKALQDVVDVRAHGNISTSVLCSKKTNNDTENTCIEEEKEVDNNSQFLTDFPAQGTVEMKNWSDINSTLQQCDMTSLISLGNKPAASPSGSSSPPLSPFPDHMDQMMPNKQTNSPTLLSSSSPSSAASSPISLPPSPRSDLGGCIVSPTQYAIHANKALSSLLSSSRQGSDVMNDGGTGSNMNRTVCQSQSVSLADEAMKRNDSGWKYYAGFMGKSESEQFLQNEPKGSFLFRRSLHGVLNNVKASTLSVIILSYKHAELKYVHAPLHWAAHPKGHPVEPSTINHKETTSTATTVQATPSRNMKDDEDSMLVQNKNPVISSSSKKRNGVENVVGQVDELCAYSYQIRGKSANDVRCFRTLDAFLKTVRRAQNGIVFARSSRFPSAIATHQAHNLVLSRYQFRRNMSRNDSGGGGGIASGQVGRSHSFENELSLEDISQLQTHRRRTSDSIGGDIDEDILGLRIELPDDLVRSSSSDTIGSDTSSTAGPFSPKSPFSPKHANIFKSTRPQSPFSPQTSMVSPSSPSPSKSIFGALSTVEDVSGVSGGGGGGYLSSYSSTSTSGVLNKIKKCDVDNPHSLAYSLFYRLDYENPLPFDLPPFEHSPPSLPEKVTAVHIAEESNKRNKNGYTLLHTKLVATVKSTADAIYSCLLNSELENKAFDKTRSGSSTDDYVVRGDDGVIRTKSTKFKSLFFNLSGIELIAREQQVEQDMKEFVDDRNHLKASEKAVDAEGVLKGANQMASSKEQLANEVAENIPLSKLNAVMLLFRSVIREMLDEKYI